MAIKILSPDGFDINPDKSWYHEDEVDHVFNTWAETFKDQGHYSSVKGRIALTDLKSHCRFIQVNEVEEDLNFISSFLDDDSEELNILFSVIEKVKFMNKIMNLIVDIDDVFESQKIVEANYPKFHQSDEILESDILHKIIDGEEVYEDDLVRHKDFVNAPKLYQKAYRNIFDWEITRIAIDRFFQKNQAAFYEAINEEGNQIAIKWSIEDVKSRAEEMEVEITEDEAMEVLHSIKDNHDATIGINWDVISEHINTIKK